MYLIANDVGGVWLRLLRGSPARRDSECRETQSADCDKSAQSPEDIHDGRIVRGGDSSLRPAWPRSMDGAQARTRLSLARPRCASRGHDGRTAHDYDQRRHGGAARVASSMIILLNTFSPALHVLAEALHSPIHLFTGRLRERVPHRCVGEGSYGHTAAKSLSPVAGSRRSSSILSCATLASPKTNADKQIFSSQQPQRIFFFFSIDCVIDHYD